MKSSHGLQEARERLVGLSGCVASDARSAVVDCQPNANRTSKSSELETSRATYILLRSRENVSNQMT